MMASPHSPHTPSMGSNDGFDASSSLPRSGSSQSQRHRRPSRQTSRDSRSRHVVFADERVVDRTLSGSSAISVNSTNAALEASDDGGGGGNSAEPYSNFGCATADRSDLRAAHSEFNDEKSGTVSSAGASRTSSGALMMSPKGASAQRVLDAETVQRLAVPAPVPAGFDAGRRGSRASLRDHLMRMADANTGGSVDRLSSVSASMPTVYRDVGTVTDAEIDDATLERVSSLPLLLCDGRGWPSKLADRLRELVRTEPRTLARYIRCYIPDPALMSPVHVAALADAIVDLLLKDFNAKFAALYPDESSDSPDASGVTVTAVAQVFIQGLELKSGMTFYDVNAGTGRSVFAAALLHDFRKLHGIEAMGSAYNTAMQTLFKAMKAKDVYTKTQRVGFTAGDMFETEWSDADVVWITATSVDEDTFQRFEQQARMLKKGSYVVCAGKRLQSFHFKSTLQRECALSDGGSVMIYSHVKLSDPPTLVIDPNVLQHVQLASLPSPGGRSVTSTLSDRPLSFLALT